MGDRVFEFQDLAEALLQIDAVYLPGRAGNAGDDPLAKLFECGNQGGFRQVGKKDQLKCVVLYSSLESRDWPDLLDTRAGTFTYFGDNKSPTKTGKKVTGLTKTSRGGNRLLEKAFQRTHGNKASRLLVPPFLIFTKAHEYGGRAVRFRGVAAPGGARLSLMEDLVAVWKQADDVRFQNYRAHFTTLDVGDEVDRAWVKSHPSDRLEGKCPPAWRDWVERRSYATLQAPAVIHHRTPAEQVPATAKAWAILQAIHRHFERDSIGFEACAAAVVEMMDPRIMITEKTRGSRDGGRDALGELMIGPAGEAIALDVAIEAKCYFPGSRDGERKANTVGVKEMARLISRLRHRQLGIMVTTSLVATQTYREIREDVHPIVVISGRDIVEILGQHGLADCDSVQRWLREEFPVAPS